MPRPRHDAPSGQDQDRRLDERGRRDAAEIGGWIGRHPPFPDPRAGLARGAGAPDLGDRLGGDAGRMAPQPQVEFLPELYGADPAQLLQIIRMASGTDPKRLMLVGHNPGMHELALALAGSGDAAGEKGARGQSADLGPCGLRLRDRRLERRGIPPRQAGAVRQPEAAENFGLRPTTRRHA